MSINQLKCQNCGDTLRLDQYSHIHNREIKCPSCHSKFIYQAKHSYIGAKSEAYREDANTDIYIEQERAKIKNEKRLIEYKIQQTGLKLSLIFLTISIVAMILMANWENITEFVLDISTVEVTESAKSLTGENYELVIDQLQDMGFENIEVAELAESKKGWFTKEGDVAKIMINGIDNFKKNDRFKSDSKVKVYYHTFIE